MQLQFKGKAKNHEGEVTAVAAAQGYSHFASAGADGSILLYVTNLSPYLVLSCDAEVRALQFLRRRLLLSASLGGGLLIWDLNDGKRSQELDGPQVPASIAVHPNQSLFAVASASGVEIWSLQTLDVEAVLKGTPGATHVTFTEDGEHLVVGRSACIELWNLSSLSVVHRIGDDKDFSPGAMLALPENQLAVGYSSIRVFDLETGERVRDTLRQNHRADLFCGLSLASDGIVAANISGSVFLASLDTHRQLAHWSGTEKITCSEAVGRSIVLGHPSGVVSFLEFKEIP